MLISHFKLDNCTLKILLKEEISIDSLSSRSADARMDQQELASFDPPPIPLEHCTNVFEAESLVTGRKKFVYKKDTHMDT